MFKSRVAPLKGERTLSQLELMAAIIKIRLAATLASAFKAISIELVFNFCSDSQIVLY